MKTTNLMVCRSAFCLKCFRNQRPQRKHRFLIYGTDTQMFKFKVCHSESIIGYTPHLYSIQFPYKKNPEGLIKVLRTCLMEGCGVDDFREEGGGLGFNFIDGYEFYLEDRHVEALLTKWKGWTGYNIF